jgi:central kinetochore subunit Mal2/MCM21
VTTLLSVDTTAAILSSSETNPLQVVARSKKQAAHKKETLYRLAAGVTTFTVKDPDPQAVDNGRVLGVRIEVCSNGRFLRPYYILLNRPYTDSQRLRVHRHTVPPCIPLAALAKKYLPTPQAGMSADTSKHGLKEQSFMRFVRSLRKEIMSYHNRASAITGLRKEFGLDEKHGKGKGRERLVEEINAADAEAKQVTIEWVDGKTGRLILGDAGQVEKCVVMGPQGRERAVERAILEHGKLEGLRESLVSIEP